MAQIDTLFQAKMIEIDTLFQTKTAKKPYPLAPSPRWKRIADYDFLRQQPCTLAFFLFKTNIMQFLSFQKCDCLYYEVTSLNYLFLVPVLVLLHNVITLIYNIFFLSIYFYVRLILYPRATSHTYSCTVHVTLSNKVWLSDFIEC